MKSFNILRKEQKIWFLYATVILSLYLGRRVETLAKIYESSFLFFGISALIFISSIFYSRYFIKLYNEAEDKDIQNVRLLRLKFLPVIFLFFFVYVGYRLGITL